MIGSTTDDLFNVQMVTDKFDVCVCVSPLSDAFTESINTSFQLSIYRSILISIDGPSLSLALSLVFNRP